jgi:hypothetical protein
VALLTHLRALDSRRLVRKDGMLNQADFSVVLKALTDLISGQ